MALDDRDYVQARRKREVEAWTSTYYNPKEFRKPSGGTACEPRRPKALTVFLALAGFCAFAGLNVWDQQRSRPVNVVLALPGPAAWARQVELAGQRVVHTERELPQDAKAPMTRCTQVTLSAEVADGSAKPYGSWSVCRDGALR